MVLRLKARSIFQFTLMVLFAIGVAFLLGQKDLINLSFLEFYAYDQLVRLRPVQPTSGLIHLVTVDQRTVAAMNRLPTIKDHIHLLEKLAVHPPKAVIYDLPLDTLTGTKQQFAKFAAITKKFPHFLVVTNQIAIQGEVHSLQLKPPLQNLEVLSGPITRDDLNFARDRVTRRMLIEYHDQIYLDAFVARMFTHSWHKFSQIRGVFPFFGSKEVFITFHPQGFYQREPFVDALKDPKSLKSLAGKIVLVGREFPDDVSDYIRTPYSRSVVAMSSLEMHANMLDTLILNDAPIRAPYAIDFFLTFLIALLTVYISFSVRPARGLLLLGGIFASYLLAAYLIFVFANVWIATVAPVLAIFISYYFFIPYRLIQENRKSWEYLQKNRLLVQVEELKTNFLSMMSHDLKTPLARIQGMTDVIAHDPQPLSPSQADALVTIRRSSEELVSFISSILDLGRVESREIKLNMVSRDINDLLHEVVRKYEFLALERSVEIREEYEPLFSVKVDIELIQQVFGNLLENAIKYSPENTRVLISTEEQNGRVLVQVADQGRGIPESELPHIFMKFYRSKDAKSSAIKGSGLGLYLAKYFVELHQGTISVDSSPGQGTTFTVELPMDQA